LLTRVDNLIERRQSECALADREAQLEATVESLRLKEQAMDEAPVGITISDPAMGDNPLMYMNE